MTDKSTTKENLNSDNNKTNLNNDYEYLLIRLQNMKEIITQLENNLLF